jgi:hypothetical protein
LIEISVPGQRWEVEFIYDSSVQIEKFISTGMIFKEQELIELFDKFSD